MAHSRISLDQVDHVYLVLIVETVRCTLKGALADTVSKERALVLSCIAARAIAGLHAVGLVHQDLKPINFLMNLLKTLMNSFVDRTSTMCTYC